MTHTHPYWLIRVTPDVSSIYGPPTAAIIDDLEFITDSEWRKHYSPSWTGELEDWSYDPDTNTGYLLVAPGRKYKYHGRLYDLEIYIDEDSCEIYELNRLTDFTCMNKAYPSGTFQYGDAENPTLGYFKNQNEDMMQARCLDMQTIYGNIIRKMNSMHNDIGHRWKLPDERGCMMYALTEATEYLESILLSIRSNDSRNNKTTDSFETITEMFDISMMLLRSLMAVFGPNDDAIEALNKAITEYQWNIKSELVLSDVPSASNRTLAKVQKLYEDEGIYIHSLISSFVSQVDTQLGINSPPDMQRLRRDVSAYKDNYISGFAKYIVPILDYILFHPIMGPISLEYENAAKKKLDKIYHKNKDS